VENQNQRRSIHARPKQVKTRLPILFRKPAADGAEDKDQDFHRIKSRPVFIGCNRAPAVNIKTAKNGPQANAIEFRKLAMSGGKRPGF